MLAAICLSTMAIRPSAYSGLSIAARCSFLTIRCAQMEEPSKRYSLGPIPVGGTQQVLVRDYGLPQEMVVSEVRRISLHPAIYEK